MFASNVESYESLRDIINKRAAPTSGYSFNMTNDFTMAAGRPTAAQPIRNFTLGFNA